MLAAISLGALLMPILLGSVGLNTTLLIMGLAIPALSVAAYPWIRALDTRAQRELAAIEPRITALQSLDIFAGATRAALERLARSAVEETVEAGAVLIREGAEADDFFVLTAGEVEVLAAGEAGAEHTLGVLGPPNYFGEIGLARAPSAHGDCESDCALHALPYQRIRLCRSDDRRLPVTLSAGQGTGAAGADTSVGLAGVRSAHRGVSRRRQSVLAALPKGNA